MTDKQWAALIKNCIKAQLEYKQLLVKAEQEYIDRFGVNPSEIDDDFWIDSMHYAGSQSDPYEIIRMAEEAAKK